MSFLKYLYNNDCNDEIINFDDDFVKVLCVSIDDINSVKLKPPPVNDKPIETDELKKNILNVKLKPVPKIEKKTYESRHPCLRELLSKRHIIF